MKSIRLMAAVVAGLAWAVPAMCQTGGAASPSDQSSQGSVAPDKGSSVGGSDIGAAQKNCHWWSFSKACRDQRALERNRAEQNRLEQGSSDQNRPTGERGGAYQGSPSTTPESTSPGAR